MKKSFAKNILFTALLSLCSTHADAQFFSGNHFHKACEINRSVALGFAMAITDREVAPPTVIGPDGNPFKPTSAVCIPEHVTSEQILDVVCEAIAKRARDRPFSASSMVGTALRSFWPCN